MAKCICPKCKSENIIPIMYGYPAPEAMEAATAGELKLGGCEVYIDGYDMPDKFCKDCEFEWSVDRFVAEDIVKVRFRYWSNWGCIDPESLTEEQWAFEVFPDGTIKYFAYPRASRKVLDKDEIHISSDRVNDFYNQVIWLYRPWTEIVDCRVCDGCSYELTINVNNLTKATTIYSVCHSKIYIILSSAQDFPVPSLELFLKNKYKILHKKNLRFSAYLLLTKQPKFAAQPLIIVHF